MVILKKPRPTEHDLWNQIFSQPLVMDSGLSEDLCSQIDRRKRLRKVWKQNLENWKTYNCGLWTVYCKKTQEPLGYCGLWPTNIHSRIEFRYAFVPFDIDKYIDKTIIQSLIDQGLNCFGIQEIISLAQPHDMKEQQRLESWGFSFTQALQRHNRSFIVYQNFSSDVFLIDTHCHLNFPPLINNPQEVLRRAAERKVQKLIVPAYNLESWTTIRNLIKTENVYGAFGIHPWVADQNFDTSRLEQILSHKKAIAIGEIGLDYKIKETKRDLQKKSLILQLEIAAEHKLPVILHCRGAFEELLEILRNFTKNNKEIRGVIHAFSSSPEIAKRFIDLGFYISFAGTITQPNARRARHSAATIGLDTIVLETDAPSIGVRGLHRSPQTTHDIKSLAPKSVEPFHVYDVALSLANLQNKPLAEIMKSTSAHANRLFSLSK